MTLLARFTTLLKADAHGVVDAVEDRALLLKQLVREAEAELLRKRGELTEIDTETRGLEAERKRVAGESKRLDEDVALALSGGKEDLARFALRKLLTLRRRADAIKRRLESLAERRSALAETLAQQEQAFEELEARAKGFLARARRAEHEDFLEDETARVADEEVELELLKRARAEGGA